MIKLRATAGTSEEEGGEVIISHNGKEWCSLWVDGWTPSDYYEVYIGVTSGKSYKVEIDFNGIADLLAGYIDWSPEINNQTPEVTDY